MSVHRKGLQSLPSRRHRLAAGVVVSVFVAAGLASVPGAQAATVLDPTLFNTHLTRAPYLTDLVVLHVNVNWATDQSATTGSLQWGPATGGTCPVPLPNTMPAVRNSTAITVGTVKEYQWKAALTLPAQGVYCYRPLLTTTDLLGTGNLSPQFTTQAAAGDTTPFSFDVFGDWGQDLTGVNPDQTALQQQIAASGARFAVTVGDNGYPSGSQINYGDLQQTGVNTSAIFGPNFWTAAGSSVPLFNTAGNHGISSKAHTDLITWTQDVAGANGKYSNGTYACCGTTGPVTYGDDWYAFDAGPARFYILDSAWGDNNVGSSTAYGQDYANHFAPTQAEYGWLTADLQAHPSGEKFVFSHYPFYADSPSQGSDPFMTQIQPGASTSIEGLLGQYGVKIVFNGHAHMYERNTASAPGMPITYVTGGGGALLQPIGPCSPFDAYGIGWSPTKSKLTTCGAATAHPPASAASSVFHFLKVTVAGSIVTVAPTNELGQVFDSMTYDFTPVVDTVIDSQPAPLTNVATASFTFHSTAAGATFACSLDGAGATACTSPTSYPGLADGAHTFNVTATANGITDPTPATASWTVDTAAPSAPTNLTATATAPTTVHLSWTGSTDNTGVTGYDVVRDGTTIGTVPGGTVSYVDASASAGTTYTYTVDARDGAGNVSLASAPATVTTPTGTTTPTLVQASGSGTAASTTATVTLPAASTQGDLLVLSASVYTGATNHITKVTDSNGKTWTRIGAYDASGHNSEGEIWYLANADPTSTVTVTLGTATSTALEVQEFSGVATSSPLDTSVGSSATGTAASSGAVTPVAGNELLVGFVAGHGNAQAMTVTAAGFTAQAQQQVTGSTGASVVTGYQVLGSPSAQSFTATFHTAMYWAAGIVAFKAAG